MINITTHNPLGYGIMSLILSGVYFETNRLGNPVLHYKGFRFNKAYIKINGKAMWRCVKRNIGCKGTAVTLGYEVLAETDHMCTNSFVYKMAPFTINKCFSST